MHQFRDYFNLTLEDGTNIVFVSAVYVMYMEIIDLTITGYLHCRHCVQLFRGIHLAGPAWTTIRHVYRQQFIDVSANPTCLALWTSI